jgi:di/tricarboxylate transporter
MLPLGVLSVLGALVALTMVLTQPMSNAAAALVVLPVAVSAAREMGVDPRSVAILVTLAASLSFIAPFEPACLLVYGPGRYRFRDFVKAGLPLTLIAFVLLLILVPWVWPLG